MSMNHTPRSNRLHIAIFGRSNAGKSSLINAITKQDAAVVSPVKGTTTDPVYKAMELLPLGPVVFIDTAGLDETGELGELRKQKTLDVLNKAELALIVLEAPSGVSRLERQIAEIVSSKGIPALGVLNKIDLMSDNDTSGPEGLASLVSKTEWELGIKVMPISALKQQGIPKLMKAISAAIPEDDDKFRIIGDLVSPGDLVVLVVPVDQAAPKGRLILPQQQTIRDLLESDAIAVATKEYELKQTLESLGKKPRMVVTDSQVFLKAAADTPRDIPLTSFSILFARQKGRLEELVQGARAIDRLQHGDKVLIAEACTHHAQADDIGTVKIPRWLRQATGKQLQFEFASGMSFPENLGDYSLIVHCGGCMLNRRQMLWRMEQALSARVPIVNYGIAIAYVQGILERAISPFPLARMAWEYNTMQDSQ
ncbi:[FeFe] hydrogenase H-cluster maturation GTPase HydF [Paenibacillus sp. NFR01]|uniref:[FeFe] hydrogenase H-cluster maturation GTPase HydF n=1 Tax=Paenibacillus sp. NFR01 TaxID=1566279 RepID=UPI0008D2A7DA|nr:[FeFe] hydrogenase H-cluster maturation GTPase HydF [Paenibacillus sp. NFR01]SET26690.1 iron-only hydrogenase maturation protein HydF [Paenibacillus sp. NFR01]